MDAPGLAQRLEAVQVVDVRYPNEWDAGHIDGSRFIPNSELADRLEELAPDVPVVTVCRSGERSTQAAALLRDQGFDAQSLDGGLLAWADAGLPLTAEDGSPGRVVPPEPPPDDLPEDLQRLQGEFMRVLSDVQAHFGDREASDEEIRGFLRDRLIRQGRTPEEADRFMAALDNPDPT